MQAQTPDTGGAGRITPQEKKEGHVYFTFGTWHHYVSPESAIAFKHLQYSLPVIINVLYIVRISVRNVHMLWITRSFAHKLMVVEEYDRTEHPLLSHKKKRRLINNTPNYFLLCFGSCCHFPFSPTHSLSLHTLYWSDEQVLFDIA